MKKRIYLGRGTAKGFENQKAEVEVKLYKDELGKTQLSIYGTVTMIRGAFVAGGQIEDRLLEMYQGNPKVTRMVEIWKEYHLNDVHPECEHQRALGWRELANETVDYSRYCLKPDVLRKQHELNVYIDEILKTSGTITLSNEERTLKSLPYSTYNLEKEHDEYYRLDIKEERRRGSLSYKEDPRGLLLKPCPVCGYEYGSAWLYTPIPEDVISEITSW